jgi:GNAT superfamily N-acetyltransferase
MISRLREYARTHGIRATASELLIRLRRAVYANDRITLLIKDLDSIAEPARTSDVRIEPLGRDKLPGLSELGRRRGRARLGRRFRSNLDRGLHGFVGIRDAETVAYYWWIEDEHADSHPDLAWLGSAVEVRSGDVYGSDFYVLPDQRQGGTANQLLYLIETALRDLGYKRIWGYVDAGNSAARWLYSSRGYRPTGEATVHKLFRHRRTEPHSPVGSPAHEQ